MRGGGGPLARPGQVLPGLVGGWCQAQHGEGLDKFIKSVHFSV